ncbi:MAG TPA: TetR/AcrR family transcriptional regulator [Vicinamibacterales bacterium]
MSPRPRATSDAQIFAATYRAVSRLGPVKLTLAKVAAEAGVSPATLVLRFGSKRGLLLAFAENGTAGAGDEVDVIRRKHSSPLEALAAFADCFAGLAPTPEVLANNLAFLQIDLVDPDFRKLADAQAQSTRREIRKFLDDAVESGELQPCDTGRLALAVAGMMNGSLLQWAIDREGDVKKRMRADLDTLLRPRRLPSKKTRRRRLRR